MKKENQKETESPYDPTFVKMVNDRTESAKNGNVVEIDATNLWESIGLK